MALIALWKTKDNAVVAYDTVEKELIEVEPKDIKDRLEEKEIGPSLKEESLEKRSYVPGTRYLLKTGDKVVELDDEMLENLRINCKDFDMNRVGLLKKKSLYDKHKELANKLRTLVKSIKEIENRDKAFKLSYEHIREVVIAGVNDGFKEKKEVYMSNNSVYKHLDGCTTVIDVDGFYKNDLGGYTRIEDAILGIANTIDKSAEGLCECLKGINDKEYNVDRLLDRSIEELLNERIIPLILSCKTDKICKDGHGGYEEKIIYVKTIYNSLDEMTYDLKVIYMAAKEMALSCV